MDSHKKLIEHLYTNSHVLDNKYVRHAFETVDRADFVHEDYTSEAYEDYPVPIGQTQTISQPTTVAFMLEKLDAQPGQRILDVGSGSGWTTVLLADIVGETGEVYGVERIPELLEFGRNNIKKYSYKNVEIFQAGEAFGLPEHAPFDRILVSAATDDLPPELIDQLKPGGVMVIPIGESVVQVAKKENGSLEQKEFAGFVFVPLIKS